MKRHLLGCLALVMLVACTGTKTEVPKLSTKMTGLCRAGQRPAQTVCATALLTAA